MTFNLLFKDKDKWGVNFMPGTYTMAYYKDYPNSKLRIIILDNYYHLNEQKTWLNTILNDAIKKDFYVITISHEETYTITEKLNTGFQTITNFEGLGNVSKTIFDDIIKKFKDNGGKHVIHLCGHEHTDYFGKTSNGILNHVIECAIGTTTWTDEDRTIGTKNYDAFDIVSFDANEKRIKIIRIGSNMDHNYRSKNTITYDIDEEKIIETC